MRIAATFRFFIALRGRDAGTTTGGDAGMLGKSA
jgi:hypothetical protein